MAEPTNIFVPQSIGIKNCDQAHPWAKYAGFDYIVRTITGDELWPEEEICRPKLQSNVIFDNIQNNQTINSDGAITCGAAIAAAGSVSSNGGAHILSNKKNFDIPHPNKPGWRLRHTCLEGPENAVFFRGRLKDKNIIELPNYWKNFVDPESITVSLTQIGFQQDLIVDKIVWGSQILIRSGSGANIDCYYLVHGTRMDGEELIVEYKGESPADYPGDNSQYSVAGYHYDTKENIDG